METHMCTTPDDRALENWLNEQVGSAYDALKADPTRVATVDQARAMFSTDNIKKGTLNRLVRFEATSEAVPYEIADAWPATWESEGDEKYPTVGI
jgi:hypothetical protein